MVRAREFQWSFGPLPQDNKPVTSNHWVDFYSERRVVPLLRSARCWALGPSGIKIKYDERGWAPAPASHHALSHISHFAHYFDIFLLTRVSRREMS